MKNILFLITIMVFGVQNQSNAMAPSISNFEPNIMGWNWSLNLHPDINLTKRMDSSFNLNIVASRDIILSQKSKFKTSLIANKTIQTLSYPFNFEQMNDFKHAKGFGSIITYDRKLTDKVEFSISLRGLHEFDIKHRPDQDSYQLTFHLQY